MSIPTLTMPCGRVAPKNEDSFMLHTHMNCMAKRYLEIHGPPLVVPMKLFTRLAGSEIFGMLGGRADEASLMAGALALPLRVEGH